jgi:hypothetical protein
MKILGRLRKRASRGRPDAHSQPDGTGGRLAIVHYDQLAEKKVIAQLAHLSRVELADVEAYERSHRARPAILERLHYARQGGVDAATAKAVSDFERRIQRRRGGSSSEQSDYARDDLEALRHEARYNRERLDLYNAKLYGGRAISQRKLRELQRAAEGAAARLKRAEDADRPATRAGDSEQQ